MSTTFEKPSKDRYVEARKAVAEQFGVKNLMAAPRIPRSA